MTTDQTRFMLHEVAKELGLPMSLIIKAMQELGFKGHVYTGPRWGCVGTRFWTRDEIRQIENKLAE